MLQVNKAVTTMEPTAAAPESGSPVELYAAFVAFLRRQLSVIVFAVLLSFALAAVYIFTAPPRYTAHAELMIDSRKVQLFQNQSVLGDIAIDSASVESQVEILKSDNIALAVIKQLHLNEDPEFIAPNTGLIGLVFGAVSRLLSAPAPRSEYENLRRAVDVFRQDLSIKRVGLTYVIDIGFQSLSSERAAQIANAVADAYIVDQLDAKYQATRRASTWLEARIHELRDQASTAERAVLDYKQQHNIVDTGGRLMSEQQLAEINSQLVVAQAQTAEAKARLDRILAIIDNGEPEQALTGFLAPDAAVADSLNNEVIVKLRSQYLEYAAREADWSRRLGPNHLAVVNLRNQMRELRKSIFDELRRIAAAYKSDYDIAVAREESIKKALAAAVTRSQSTDQAGVALSQLQSSSQTYRALYDNFLQRYMEATQQESFPITEARLISLAARPLSKSQPKTLLIFALATSVGLLLGFGAGVIRELADRVFRTGTQVETQLHTDCIAVLPRIAGAKKPARDANRTGEPPQDGTRLLVNDQSILWNVVNAPFSRFAEATRAIKVAADIYGVSKANRIIGVTSSVPNEGKSTIATSLALLMAQGGSRVILVDADLRNPVLTRQLAAPATGGLIELISGQAALNNVVWTDPTSKLAFLPTVLKTRLPHTSDLLSSAPMAKLTTALREAYEFVVVDMSPVTPVVDVRATTGFVDSYLYVIEWGRTKMDIVEHALDGARGIYDNLLGVVLNKADFDVLKLYDGYRGNYYYRRYYKRYGYTD